jgi:hypothetical protein
MRNPDASEAMVSRGESPLSEPVLDAVARTLGLEHCNPELVWALNHAFSSYLAETQTDTRVRRGQIAKYLNDISETAQKLTGLLLPCREADDPSAAEVECALRAAGGYNPSLIEELDQLGEASQRALLVLAPEKGGRPADIAFHALLAKLKAFFELATNETAGITWDDYRQEYTGAFFDFVSIIEGALAQYRGVPPRSNSALGDLVRQVSRGRQRRPRRPPSTG